MEEKIRSAIESHIACAGVLSSQWGLIGQIASAIGGAVRKGGKVLKRELLRQELEKKGITSGKSEKTASAA